MDPRAQPLRVDWDTGRPSEKLRQAGIRKKYQRVVGLLSLPGVHVAMCDRVWRVCALLGMACVMLERLSYQSDAPHEQRRFLSASSSPMVSGVALVALAGPTTRHNTTHKLYQTTGVDQWYNLILYFDTASKRNP